MSAAMRRPVRNVFLLGILVGLVLAVVRARRQGDAHPGAVGSGTPPLASPSGPARPVRYTPPAGTSTTSARPSSTGASATAPSGSARPSPLAGATAPSVGAAPEPAPGASWVRPVDGVCPSGYLVKAKEASKIFHIPGGAFYARTKPERCYRTVADAEADGYRASKR